MPELPEVETIRQGLQDLIVGYQIVGIETDSPKQVQPSLGLVQRAIQGSTLLRVDRRAKIVLLFFDNGKILAIHLKLTGRLLVRKAGSPKDDWQHVTLSLRAKRSNLKNNEIAAAAPDGEPRNDGEADLELRFCDARKFGWVRLLGNLSNLGDLGNYGPDPFTKEFSVVYLQKIFSETVKPVKVVIMDQEKISGIGNIYANDGLFLAKIDPRKPSKQLNNLTIQQLFKAIKMVLELGLKDGGASDQYYLNAYGKKGFYQEHFLVYGLQGKPCQNHCGGLIKRIVVGGRGTFLCEKCQV